MLQSKDSTSHTGDRDLARLVVKTDPRLSERLNAVRGGRRYKHPLGHLLAGSALMRTLKDR
jgi:hypothetical protein